VSLPDGKDWLMRPVLSGLCKYESLKNCELDLCDIAEMNEALDAKDENEARARKAAENER
jgi:hypothetical protein